MEWFRCVTSICCAPDFLALPGAVRGAWLSLCALCAAQENGGRVRGSARWDDRRWLVAVNATVSEIADVVAADLAVWDGDDLVVAHYDPEAEKAARKRKESAASAARAKWEAIRADASRNAPRIPPRTSERTAAGNAEERRGEESREEEKKDISSEPGGTDAVLPVKKRKQAASTLAYEIAEYLVDAIQSHDESYVTRSREKWALDIDLAMRIDRRTPDDLRAAIDYAHRSPEGAFWRGNILSGAKLREKFDTLKIQSQRKAQASPGLSAKELWERAEALEALEGTLS